MLKILTDLASVHLVFYVSLFKKYIGDLALVMPLEVVRLKASLCYKDVPVQILDCQVHKLRNN